MDKQSVYLDLNSKEFEISDDSIENTADITEVSIIMQMIMEYLEKGYPRKIVSRLMERIAEYSDKKHIISSVYNFLVLHCRDVISFEDLLGALMSESESECHIRLRPIAEKMFDVEYNQAVRVDKVLELCSKNITCGLILRKTYERQLDVDTHLKRGLCFSVVFDRLALSAPEIITHIDSVPRLRRVSGIDYVKITGVGLFTLDMVNLKRDDDISIV